MNFSDLEYFNYLCKVKSFTKVAEDLFVSQPSISMSISRMEKELGTKLISRGNSKKNLEITEAGGILAEGSAKIIRELENIKSKINELNNKKIKFGIPPIVSSFFFISYIKNLMNTPVLNYMDIIQISSENLIENFSNGKIDMAIVGLSSKIKIPGFDFDCLNEDKFVLCINKKYFSFDSKNIQWGKLDKERWIVLDDSYLHKIVFKKLCNKLNLNPQNIVYVTDIKTAIDFLELGIGIGIFLEIIVANSSKIKKINLPIPDEFYIYLASKNFKYLSKNEREIKKMILEIANYKKYIFYK